MQWPAVLLLQAPSALAGPTPPRQPVSPLALVLIPILKCIRVLVRPLVLALALALALAQWWNRMHTG